MTPEQLEQLNSEHLAHTVWITDGKGGVVGRSEQTIEQVGELIVKGGVVKVECVGWTLEDKARECQRWGCE